MKKIENQGVQGYFISEEEYQSMLESYNKIHSLILSEGGMTNE